MFTQPHSQIVKIFNSSAGNSFFAGVNTVFADDSNWNFNDSDLVVDHGTGTLTSNFVAANILFAAGTQTTPVLRLGGPGIVTQGGTSNTNNGGNSFSVSTVAFQASSSALRLKEQAPVSTQISSSTV
jgi:hypothetical protein